MSKAFTFQNCLNLKRVFIRPKDNSIVTIEYHYKIKKGTWKVEYPHASEEGTGSISSIDQHVISEFAKFGFVEINHFARQEHENYLKRQVEEECNQMSIPKLDFCIVDLRNSSPGIHTTSWKLLNSWGLDRETTIKIAEDCRKRRVKYIEP